jgi:F-type H+-transporting ATPase subunit a
MGWNLVRIATRLTTSATAAFVLYFVVFHSSHWLGFAQAGQEGHPHPAAQGAVADSHTHSEVKAKSALTHVTDSRHWELFESFGLHEIELPVIFGVPITKFMILEVLAALAIIAIYLPLAMRIRDGELPRGTFVNFFEVFLTFVREDIAKPGIGEHDADEHVPFLWTLFLFILFNNLFGLIPFLGSATASIYVTLGLALLVFGYMHGHAIIKMGLVPYLTSLWPNFDIPIPGLGFFIKLLIFGIEWMGVLVRNMVLAVRLFANVFAGHMVLATFLIFIWMAQNLTVPLWSVITLTSVLGIIALSLLELFVACLQAYIFTFLTALFMGMALHPEH